MVLLFIGTAGVVLSEEQRTVCTLYSVPTCTGLKHRTYKAGFLYKFTAETIVNNLQLGAKFVEPSKKTK